MEPPSRQRRPREARPLSLQLLGKPIRVSCGKELTAHRGKLLSGQPGRGRAVYAASFIRTREIVLETDLLRSPRDLRLVVIHELFHFVWARLGHRRRAEFAGLLLEERRRGARGELGESAGMKKDLLRPHDDTDNTPRWRDYVCESFCDTAASIYSPAASTIDFPLARRWRKLRADWFQATFQRGCNC